ncbi:MAG: hypothetical protein CSA31_02680, partial [Desulfobulbus propionicus]
DIWWIDEQHRIVKINETARFHSSLAQVELIGALHHEIDPAFLPATLERLFSGQEKNITYQRQFPLKNGEIDVSEETLHLRDTSSGRFVVRYGRNLLKIQHGAGDQTEKEQGADTVAAQGREQSGNMRNEFIANMNHEIRTPMNAIIGYAEMLLEGDLSPREKRFAQAIFKSGMSLVSILNDIIDLSKIEAGRMKLSVIAVNLQEIVQDLRKLLADQLVGKDIRFVTHIAEDLPQVVFIDGVRLKQVLQNLLSNAMKFTPQGSVELHISGENHPHNRDAVELIIAVKDTGIGIPQQDHSIILRILNPNSGGLDCTYKGRGFGLALCGRLVAMMGGTINLESTEGQGSIFTVNFPGVAVSPQLDQFATIPKPAEREERVQGKLLVVDDMDLIHDVLRDYFRNSPIEILAASTGDEAITIAEEASPDIIFMDLHLDGKDGRVIAKELKQATGTADIPVFVMTGDVLEEEEYAPTFDGFLQKPFRFDEMAKIVHSYCRKNAPANTSSAGCTDVHQQPEPVDNGYEKLRLIWNDTLEDLLHQAVYSGSLSKAINLGVMIKEQGQNADEQAVITLGDELIQCATENNIFCVEQLLRHLESNDR